MNSVKDGKKEALLEILQTCLLYYEGVGKEELETQGLSPSNIKIGIKLKDYLEAKV